MYCCRPVIKELRRLKQGYLALQISMVYIPRLVSEVQLKGKKDKQKKKKTLEKKTGNVLEKLSIISIRGLFYIDEKKICKLIVK